MARTKARALGNKIEAKTKSSTFENMEMLRVTLDLFNNVVGFGIGNFGAIQMLECGVPTKEAAIIKIGRVPTKSRESRE